jgi:hypothetical protein
MSPTDNLYPAGRCGSALAKLNSALTPLLARWCVWKGLVKGLSTRFQTGASSCPQNISKTPTPMLWKPYNRECTEECTLILDPRSVDSGSPTHKYPKRLLLSVLPHARQEPVYPSQHMHREVQRIYTLIYIYIYILFCYSAPRCILYRECTHPFATRSCPVATGVHSGCNLFTSGCN